MSIQRPEREFLPPSSSPTSSGPSSGDGFFSRLKVAVTGGLSPKERRLFDRIIEAERETLKLTSENISLQGRVNDLTAQLNGYARRSREVGADFDKVQKLNASQFAEGKKEARVEIAVGVVVAFVIYQLASYYLFPSETK